MHVKCMDLNVQELREQASPGMQHVMLQSYTAIAVSTCVQIKDILLALYINLASSPKAFSPG